MSSKTHGTVSKFAKKAFKKGKRKYKYPKKSLKFIPVGLPKSMFVRLRYAMEGSVTMDSTAGAHVVHLFRLNDLYDPDLTGASGHTARFRDQLCGALYARYTVLYAKALMRYSYVGVGEYTGFCTTSVSRKGSGRTSRLDYAEDKNRKSSLLAPNNGYVEHRMGACIRKEFGLSKNATIVGNSDFTTSATGNPEKILYLHCSWQPLSASTQNISLSGYIDFYTLLTGYVLPASSDI